MQAAIHSTPIDNARRAYAAPAAACAAGRLGRLPLLAPVMSVAALASVLCLGAALFDETDVLAQCAPYAALLACLFLGAKALAAQRRAAWARQRGWIDASTGLYNNEGMAACGNALLAARNRRGRELSMVVFDCADLQEVRAIYGNRIGRALLERLIAKLQSLAGSNGLAARTGPTEFTVVLPMSRGKALHAIHRALGSPTRIELDAGDDEIVVVPDFTVGSAAPGLAAIESLHRSLGDELARMTQAEQQRRTYLRRERERHSRPMVIPGDQPAIAG